MGFDAHMVGQHETGNETYALGLLQGLQDIGFSADVYTNAHLPPSNHRVHRVTPSQSIVRIPLVSPLLAVRDRLELFHATYVLPPLLPCPAVVTVHDITFALRPDWFGQRVRVMLGRLVPIALREAAVIITISQTTKRDIVETYGTAPEKIVVTQLAPRPIFAIREDPAPSREPFFLYVGNVEPRKNMETVIEALCLLRDRGIDFPLVIVGKPGLHFSRIDRMVGRLGMRNLVQFRGYVPDEQLRRLYATCTALLHPAIYEGFGITPLEAMVQGTPVITTNTSSIPEVVGDAAIMLDPYDVESWAETLYQIVHDEHLRRSLTQRGLERVHMFSWERCATETLAVYRSALAAA